jgi:dTDP-4-amino-4,6-dideoxygalactose transaminase
MTIPFNKMTVVGNEEKYLLEALHSGKWCGRGSKTLALEKLVKEKCQAKHAFFVTSCTSALEISTLISKIEPGDEVILPSFGFVSAANAVVLRGARPVFADIDLSTWNISLSEVEPLITPKTRAILPVHYAGSTAGIEDLRAVCQAKGIFLIEDAAQSLGAKRGGHPVGSTPWTTCFSLHETKNISAGEGGLIMTDSDELAGRIEIQIEKGTNRQKFFRGQVDKYTWVDRGSSYIASDLLAAVALAQMERLEQITAKRTQLLKIYRETLAEFDGLIHWQELPKGIETNGHVAAFRVNPAIRGVIIKSLRDQGVEATFHYVPLHDSPFAKEQGLLPKTDLPNTRAVSEGLVRLPIFFSMSVDQAHEVAKKTADTLQKTVLRP